MKNTISLFSEKKRKEKITMLTCYDYSTACILNETDIDAILVGDSLGMVFQGNEDTLSVSVDDMIYHTKAVKKGAKNKFIITDMPFLSYHISIEETIKNAGRIIKEGGAEAVKLEGGREIIDKIKGLIDAKIPVMAHLGLTPQSINIFGGYKVQGKIFDEAKRIIEDALILENSGVFAIVLECIPEKLASLITEKLKIPTIGIGAGKNTDGQILVINDALGIFKDIVPKFVKKFVDISQYIKIGVNDYIKEVKTNTFPDISHTFKIENEIFEKIKLEFEKY